MMNALKNTLFGKPKMYLIDRAQGIAVPMPSRGSGKIISDPAKWTHGDIYRPPGAIFINAHNANDALRKADEFFECTNQPVLGAPFIME